MEHNKSRVCLFAGYNESDIAPSYVIDYISELARHSDVYYMADGDLDKVSLQSLKRICKGVWNIRHGKYDFGSYSELANKYVGWDTLSDYEEVIFANDSCFCVQGFDQVFDKMGRQQCDVWGLLATDENNYGYFYTLEEYLRIPSKKVPLFCIGSYFLVFKNNVITDNEFQQFINSVSVEPDRHIVCIKYEMGLTSFLNKKNYKLAAYVDIVYRNVAIYTDQSFRLLNRGFPLIKIRIFKDNPLSIDNLDAWVPVIKTYVRNNKIDEYLAQINYREQVNPKLFLSIYDAWLPPLFKSGYAVVIKSLLPPAIFTFLRNIKLRLKNRQSSKPDQIKANNDLTLTPCAGKYIIYFNVARDTIGGGMLSINRFVEQTMQLFEGTETKIMVSGLPFENLPVHYSLFEEKLPMIHFNHIISTIHPENLILHIPEHYFPRFILSLTHQQKRWLKSVPFLQINILDQNHDYFPAREYFEHCKDLTDNVTATMAHKEYVTPEIAESIDCPIRKLTPFLPEFYRTTFESKEKIIAISPDEFIFDSVSKKDESIAYLTKKLPDYKIIIIENLSLEEYKKLISKALFTITFGEGYDGYFIEPFLSDSIAFAVYNKMFFPSEFLDAPTVYNSWGQFMKTIVTDIRKLEKDPKIYNRYNKLSEAMIRKHTNNAISLQDLNEFYANKFEIIPEVCKRSGYYTLSKI